MTIEVSIDRDGCISCGNCWASCPEVFRESPGDGKSEIVPASRKGGDPGAGTARDDYEECVLCAEGGCPVSVIHTG